MPEYQKIAVKTWYLRFNPTKKLQITPLPDELTLEKWTPEVEEYLKIYKQVGEPWGWTGRLLLTEDNLKKLIESENIELFVLKKNNKIIGFSELEQNEQGTEIVYFGLVSSEIGHGVGSLFFADIVHKFGVQKPGNLWLHTCEFDSDHALDFYKKLGFEISKTQIDYEYYSTKFLMQHNRL